MEYELNEEDDDIFNDIENTYFQLGSYEDQPGPNHLAVLKAKFGHSKFRPMQWQVIKSIIEDKKDNCVVMATGYGKSLCYQYPAVFSNKITLVVSPLISLMEDQVLSLNLANINACFLGSAQSNKNILDDIYQGFYSLVYVTPEYITGPLGETMLKTIEDQLVLVGIDEAHCVSQWGHDFRNAYRNLSRIRTIVPGVPFLAVTATATTQVLEDITNSLKLRHPNIRCTGFDRPNLQFFVRIKGSSVWNDLKTILLTHNGGSVIIYCITRKITDDIAELLRINGLKCEAYHAGLSIKQRRQVHENFVKDKIRIIIATIAFGMGIDKPDVRLVIHYGCSKDMESYYQEVGRAGRDGGLSKCITFYNRQDMKLHETLRENYSHASQTVKNNLSQLSNKMYEYLNTSDCRRNFILKYFEGNNFVRHTTKTFCCDNCAAKKSSIASVDQMYEEVDKDGNVDFTVDSKLLLEALDAFNGKTGLGFPILLLRGSRVKRLNERYYTHPLHGKGKQKPEEWWKILAALLEHRSFIKKQSVKGPYANIYTLSITREGYEWMTDSGGVKPLKLKPTKDMFQFFKRKRITPAFSTSTINNMPSTSNGSATNDVPVPNPELELSHKIRLALLQTRSDLATEIDVMPYMIASNTALTQMSKLRPTSLECLRDAKLDGFSDTKISKFGTVFINCIVEAIKSAENENNSIESIIAEHPIPGTKLNTSRELAYKQFMAGHSICEVASRLNVQTSTISSYLSECIRCGLRFTRNDLKRCDISDEVFNIITREIPKNSLNSKLKDLKDRFPDYTWDTLRLVSSYHQVRQHIKNLNIPFHDPDAMTPLAQSVAPEHTSDALFSDDDEDISFEELDKIILTAESGGNPDVTPPEDNVPDNDSLDDDDIVILENEILDKIEQCDPLDSLKKSTSHSEVDEDSTDDELPEYYLKALDKANSQVNTTQVPDRLDSCTTPVLEVRTISPPSPKLLQNSSQSSETRGKSSVLKRRAVPNKKVIYDNSDDDNNVESPPSKMTGKRNMPAWLANNFTKGSIPPSTVTKKTKSSLF